MNGGDALKGSPVQNNNFLFWKDCFINMGMNRRSLLFFGGGTFSATCLKALLAGSSTRFSRIATVVPNRRTELALMAHEAGYECIETPNGSLHGWFPSKEPFDFGAVASFPFFLPGSLIDWFRQGIINAHPSLLPAWRGAAPIQRSLIAGEWDRMGISIISLDKKHMDAGKLYYQKRLALPPWTPYMEAEKMLAEHCGLGLRRVFDEWDIIEPADQAGDITLAPKITVTDSIVSFKAEAVENIYKKFLAIGHQERIRARLAISGKTVHFLDMELVGLESPQQQIISGFTELHRRRLVIYGSDGIGLSVGKFRVEGKSSTFSAAEFYHGFISRINDKFS